MSYYEIGNLVTESREVAVSETWDSDSDFDPNKQQNDVVIDNGVLKLDELPDISTLGVFSNELYVWAASEGSGDTVSDHKSDSDGTISDLDWISGDYVGGYGVDGTSKDGQVEFNIDSFGSKLDSDFAIAFCIDGYTANGRNNPFGVEDGNLTLTGFFGNNNDGDVALNLSDNDNNNLRIYTDSGGLVDDGDKHTIVIEKTANSGSSAITIYVDDTEEPTSVDVDQGFGNVSDFSIPFEWLNGPFDGACSAINGDMVICDGGVTSQEVSDYHDAQPWT